MHIKSKIETEKIKQQNIASKEDYAKFLKQFIGKQITNDDFKESIFQLLIRKVVLFRDKLRITFNFSPDKGKHNKNIDVDADLAEVKEAQEEYKSGAGGSNLSSPTPPLENCTHPNDKKLGCVYFFSTEYFGIRVDR